jgi:hypothetical protein
MSDLVDGSLSNWADARRVFRERFLTVPPVSSITSRRGYFIDGARVSADVFELAVLRKNLPAARALWLAEHGWQA